MSSPSVNTHLSYCTTKTSTLLGMAHVLSISLTKIFRPENVTGKRLKNIITIFKYANTLLSVHKVLLKKPQYCALHFLLNTIFWANNWSPGLVINYASLKNLITLDITYTLSKTNEKVPLIFWNIILYLLTSSQRDKLENKFGI